MAFHRVSPFSVGLAVAVAIALALRLAIISGPLGEIDGDEAIVGLMARHIAFLGEYPVFYWGQPYLGSLEAFSAALLFRLFDSSTLLLKLVPTAYSLGFLVLSAVVGRRMFGTAAALATAAYLSVPPAMWAVWSTKARGGYAELLFLGQALLLVTLVHAGSPRRRLALLWGVLAGLALWTHPLAVVYVLPAFVFLILARRTLPGRARRKSAAELGLGILGAVLGMAPLIVENLRDGFLTLAALVQPADLPLDRLAQSLRFFRVGVLVLLGFGQPTTSQSLFDQDWLRRPASNLWLAAAVLLIVMLGVASHASSIRRLVVCGADRLSAPALLVLLALIVPPVVALTRFGFLVSEPRYALPLYSVVPLLAGALWRPWASLSARAEVIRWGVVVVILGFNLWSLVSTDVRLWRPEDAPDSTAATRQELVRYLVAADRHQMYTDYWIGYPVMFETRETVLPYVISGGFNRYVPPADNVQRTPNPAWVFTPGMDSETVFLDHLAAVGGQVHVVDISVYRVYTDVQPLALLRPAGLITRPAPGTPP